MNDHDGHSKDPPLARTMLTILIEELTRAGVTEARIAPAHDIALAAG